MTDVSGQNVSVREESPVRSADVPSSSLSISTFNRGVLMVVLAYVLLASFWIVFTDKIVAALGADPKVWERWSILKGMLFILVTATLLYVLIRRLVLRLNRTHLSLQASELRQQRVAADLRKGEERFRAIFDSTPAAMGISRMSDNQFVDVNDSFLRLSGYIREELLGHTSVELGLWPKPEERERMIEILRTSGRVHQLEAKLRRKSGEITDVMISADIIELNGAPHLMGILSEISERKKAEDALRMEKERLDHASIAGGIGLWEWDITTNRLEWSGAVDSMLGYAPGTFPRTISAWEQSIHPEDLARESLALAEHFQKGAAYDIEYRMRRRDGTYVWWRDAGACRRDGKGSPKQMSGACIDISERKGAEDALGRERILTRMVIDQIPDPIYAKDEESRFVLANKALALLLGLNSDADLLGKTDADFYPKELAEGFRVDEERVLSGMAVLNKDEPLILPDGSRRSVLTTKLPFRDRQGKVIGLVGIGRDITERVLADQALRASETRYRSLFENMLEGYAYCSMIFEEGRPQDFIYLDVNNAFEKLTGLKGVVGKRVTEVIPGIHESNPEIFEIYGRVVLSGTAEKLESYFEPLEAWLAVTVYAAGDGCFVAVFDNITERKQAELELRRLMTAIEQVPESVVITDAQGRILYVNPAFELTTGYSRAEAIGKNPRILKSGKHEDAFYRELWTKISAGEVWRGRFINKKKDGQFFSEEAAIAPVRDAQGRIVNYLAVKRDITRELRQEEQYLQTQKMDSIGRLAGGVAHDFNNILSVILGNAGLALLELPENHPVRGNIEEIERSSERAANLTRQLLAFARRQVIEPKLVNLNELIENLNKMLHRLIGEDVELVTRMGEGLGQIKADPGQMEQVILNLVVNARDAMPEGGVLTLKTENLTLNGQFALANPEVSPGEYVVVNVSDTGHGIDEETQRHIFEPFFTTKEQGKGTGLGLATCFGIVKQNKGIIKFDSQVGRGTTFRVYLPRVRETVAAPDKGDTEFVSIRGTETILLAEDELSLRQLLARVLRTHGYKVLEAANGAEALALIQAHGAGVQLLVTDIVMPGMNGKNIAEWMGEVNPATRILFMSGYISNVVVRDAMMKPGTYFLQKPFTPSDLAKKARAALDGLHLKT